MKTCYVDIEHRAIADLIAPGELTPNWTITRINVPEKFRGNGLGSKLLDEILADADAEGQALQLEILPSGPLDYDQLEAWYKRRGFRRTVGGYMKRTPAALEGKAVDQGYYEGVQLAEAMGLLGKEVTIRVHRGGESNAEEGR